MTPGGNQLTADYAAARGIDLDGLRVGISGSVGQMFGALFGSEHLALCCSPAATPCCSA